MKDPSQIPSYLENPCERHCGWWCNTENTDMRKVVIILSSDLLWCLQPGPLEDKVSVLKRSRTVEGIIGQIIVRVEDTQLTWGQHVLVPSLPEYWVMKNIIESVCWHIRKHGLQADHPEMKMSKYLAMDDWTFRLTSCCYFIMSRKLSLLEN